MNDVGAEVDPSSKLQTATVPTTYDSIVAAFSSVSQERGTLVGAPLEFSFNGVPYTQRNPDSDGTIDLNGVDLTDPTLRMAFLYGEDVHGSPNYKPAYVHVFQGPTTEPVGSVPDGVVARDTSLIDIQPETPDEKRVMRDKAAGFIHGFTKLGEAGHELQTAYIGGSVVYEMADSRGQLDIQKNRLLAMWVGHSAT